jgi:c-di-GMP-binding flagellar brake protein YcgR
MMLQMEERRRFVRHPICYPLEVTYASKKAAEKGTTINISQGGLLFLSKRKLKCGKIIVLKLPLQDKLFKVRARIVHVNPDKENPKLYNVGVSFYRYSDAFKVKLIEQVYLIDDYRILRSIQLGREVSFREASEEWIRRYSKRFSRLFWGRGNSKKK